MQRNLWTDEQQAGNVTHEFPPAMVDEKFDIPCPNVGHGTVMSESSMQAGWTQPLEHIPSRNYEENLPPLFHNFHYSTFSMKPVTAESPDGMHSTLPDVVLRPPLLSSSEPLSPHALPQSPGYPGCATSSFLQQHCQRAQRLCHMDEPAIKQSCENTLSASGQLPRLIHNALAQQRITSLGSPTNQEPVRAWPDIHEPKMLNESPLLPHWSQADKLPFLTTPVYVSPLPNEYFMHPPIPIELDQNNLQPQFHKRKRRFACTCPNCKIGLNVNTLNPDGTVKKKQHACHFPNCHRVFTTTSHLTRHLRWHTGERPFTCEVCEKRFMRSDHLNKHVKTHILEEDIEESEIFPPVGGEKLIRGSDLGQDGDDPLKRTKARCYSVDSVSNGSNPSVDDSHSSPNAVSETISDAEFDLLTGSQDFGYNSSW